MKTSCRFILVVLSLATFPAMGATTYVEWGQPDETWQGDVLGGAVTNGNTSSVILSTLPGGLNGVNDDSIENRDMVRVVGGIDQRLTLSFSNPVVNPRIDIYSLSNPTVGDITWTFSHPLTLLNGTLIQTASNEILGNEASGTILFTGTFSSLSWTTSLGENFTGIQVGVEDVLGVPEPSRTLLLFTGIACMALRRSRR